MTKIIKNTTNANIELQILGITLPANSSTAIDQSDFDTLALSESILELVPLLNSGDIVMNDGVKDLSSNLGLGLINGSYVTLDNTLVQNDRIKVDVTGTLSDGKVKVSGNDSTSGFLEDKISAEDNKINIQVTNEGENESVQIGINPENIDTSELNNDANFINSSQAPVQISDIADFETSTQLDGRDTVNRDRVNHIGTQLASTISDFNSAVREAETTTSLSLNIGTNILTYTDENGSATNLDLSPYVDNTNLPLIVSGVLNSSTGMATFTRDDNSTFTVDFSSLNDQSFINTAIATHEASIDNHNDVDVTTNAPVTGSFLKYDGTNWIPYSEFKTYIVDETPKGTQGTSFQEYLSLTFTIPETGDYIISWYYKWSINTTSSNFLARIQLDDTDSIMSQIQEVQDSAGTGITVLNITGGTFNSGTDQRYNESGHKIRNLSPGTYTIDLDLANEVNNTEATIYEANITIERF